MSVVILVIGFVGGYVASVYSWDKVKAFYDKVKDGI